MDPKTQPEKRGKFRWLPRLVFAAIVVLGTLKLALVLVPYLMSGEQRVEPLSPPDVMAEDQEERKTENTSPESEASARPSSESQQEIPLTPEMISYLEEKEKALDKKEEELQELEKELKAKYEELMKLQESLKASREELEAFREERQEEQSSQIRSLAKIYSTMKAKEAGKLMENLNDDLVVKIIKTMKSEEAADILSSMDPKKAARISMALSMP